MALKKRRTPQQKKQLRYEKDHVAPAEYPHAFRRLWPKKKALTNRAYRRKAQQALMNSDKAEAQSSAQVIRRKSVRKWEVISLREQVNRKIENRRARLGWNFFKRPYSTRRDREPFIAFLQSVMAGNSEESIELARVISRWLTPAHYRESRVVKNDKMEWLKAFFHDEPRWNLRLRSWVEATLSSAAEE